MTINCIYHCHSIKFISNQAYIQISHWWYEKLNEIAYSIAIHYNLVYIEHIQHIKKNCCYVYFNGRLLSGIRNVVVCSNIVFILFRRTLHMTINRINVGCSSALRHSVDIKMRVESSCSSLRKISGSGHTQSMINEPWWNPIYRTGNNTELRRKIGELYSVQVWVNT